MNKKEYLETLYKDLIEKLAAVNKAQIELSEENGFIDATLLYEFEKKYKEWQVANNEFFTAEKNLRD